MPITTLSLTRASLVWKPGLAIRLRGYGVISAIAYDGTKGILPVAALPPMHFRRRPRRSYDFVAPTPADVGDDGILIATFADTPPAVGWAITLTLTDTREQAKEVIQKTLSAATAAFALIPGMSALSGAAKVATDVSDAIMGVVGARIVGTWINSESDAADLRRDWRATHDDFKARFELDYDVKRGGPSEDD